MFFNSDLRGSLSQFKAPASKASTGNGELSFWASKINRALPSSSGSSGTHGGLFQHIRGLINTTGGRSTMLGGNPGVFRQAGRKGVQ